MLHLDHGRTLQDILRAIQAGFTSVMFDGSELPYEENIRQTKAVVDLAHLVGVSVEGEVGKMCIRDRRPAGRRSDRRSGQDDHDHAAAGGDFKPRGRRSEHRGL